MIKLFEQNNINNEWSAFSWKMSSSTKNPLLTDDILYWIVLSFFHCSISFSILVKAMCYNFYHNPRLSRILYFIYIFVLYIFTVRGLFVCPMWIIWRNCQFSSPDFVDDIRYYWINGWVFCQWVLLLIYFQLFPPI